MSHQLLSKSIYLRAPSSDSPHDINILSPRTSSIVGFAEELWYNSPSMLVALTSKPIDRFLSCSCTLWPHKDPTNAYLPSAPMATFLTREQMWTNPRSTISGSPFPSPALLASPRPVSLSLSWRQHENQPWNLRNRSMCEVCTAGIPLLPLPSQKWLLVHLARVAVNSGFRSRLSVDRSRRDKVDTKLGH